MQLKKLNSLGKEKFIDFIHERRENPNIKTPFNLLDDEKFCEDIKSNIEIDAKKFKNRWELGKYLNDILKDLDQTSLLNDESLWMWITLLYFDLIKGGVKSGTKFIPELESFQNRKRHLIFQSWIMAKEDKYKLIAESQEIHIHSDMCDKVFSYQKLVHYESVLKVVDLIYFEKKKIQGGYVWKVKQNCVKKEFAGSVEKLELFIDWLDSTYDVNFLSADDIIKKLPDEFDKFIENGNSQEIIKEKKKLPDWTEDEVTLVLDFYFSNKHRITSLSRKEVEDLSKELRNMNVHDLDIANEPIYRNYNGVYTKLMNFVAIDNKKKKGLSNFSKTDLKIMKKYKKNKNKLKQDAKKIRKNINK